MKCCVTSESLCVSVLCRLGLVFVVNDLDDVDGMQDAGVALLRAFNYIASDVDNQMAFDAVISVSQCFIGVMLKDVH